MLIENNMNIMVDYQILVRQDFGGVSRYHYELVKLIKTKYHNFNVFVPILFSRNKYFEELFGKKAFSYKNKWLNYFFRIINDIYSFWFLVYRVIISDSIDIVHITWYQPFYLKLYKKIPFIGKKIKIVVTIHDMIHELECNENMELRRGVKQKQSCIEMADAVICVSENTKKDLLYFYPNLDSEKISVIYHGFPQQIIKTEEIDIFPDKYILFVGQRKQYKNFNFFIKAVSELLRKYQNIYVICAGGGKFDDEENNLLKDLGIEKYVSQKSMTDEELIACYSRAICFVYPSKYEGFGMPILEAFKYNCPVILSNASCFPEIADNAVLYFDPNKDIELKEQVEKVLYDNKLRDELIERGRNRLNHFSWETTTQRTVQIYEGVLN